MHCTFRSGALLVSSPPRPCFRIALHQSQTHVVTICEVSRDLEANFVERGSERVSLTFCIPNFALLSAVGPECTLACLMRCALRISETDRFRKQLQAHAYVVVRLLLGALITGFG